MSAPITVIYVLSSDETYRSIREVVDSAHVLTYDFLIRDEGQLVGLSAEVQPDLVLIDYDNLEISVARSMEIISERWIDTPVVFLAENLNEAVITAALAWHVRDFVLLSRLNRLPFVIKKELANKEKQHVISSSSKALSKQLNYLSMLSQSTVGFLQLNSEDNLFRYISDQLKIFMPNALIVINEFDTSSSQLICRHMDGFDELNKILTRYGSTITEGSAFPVSDDERLKLLQAKLYRAEGGLHEVLLRQFPKPICKQIHKQLGVNDVLAIGLVWKGEIYGNAVMITFNQTPDFTPSVVETLINTASVAIQRKSAEEAVVRSLREKEVMLKEIHHRVKNNLQIVSSLLELQAHQLKDDATRALFSDSQSRVKSMALVHERLYRSADLAHINYRIYLEELVEYLFSTFTRSNVRYEIDADEVMLSIDSAVPSGIIINELVTNSLKYAFPDGRTGIIRLSLKQVAGHVMLEVSDNGVGMPETIDLRTSSTLGLELVTALIEQLNATVELGRTEGTRFTIKIPI